MKRFTFFLAAIAPMAGLVALVAPAPGHASGESAPAFVTEIPHGYRDWRWISSAHEAGGLNSIGALLGNDVAIKAYRDGKLPFPDGTMLAALHYRYVPSDENNKVFGQAQSFVPGAPVASRIIWHTSELIIWRTSCESGVKRLGEGIFRGNMKL